MSNLDVSLKQIAKTEEKIYILKGIALKNKPYASSYDDYEFDFDPDEIKSMIYSSIPRPNKPVEPYEKIQPIPPYDKALYFKKAKAAGKVVGWRHTGWQLTGIFCCSLIGLIIGIPLLWFMIVSWPFSQGALAKAAHQMYIADCEELERKNDKLANELYLYNHAMTVYKKELERYQAHQANMPLKTELCKKSLLQIKNLIYKLEEYTDEQYDNLSIPSDYQNFVAIHMLCHYVDKYKLTSLSDAISMMETDYSSGKIWFDIQHIQSNKKAFEKHMSSVINELKKCDEDVDMLVDGLVELCNNLGQSGKENSDSASYTKFIQQCTN